MTETLRELVESLSKPVAEAAAWALLEESSRVLTQKIQEQGENIRPFITPDYVLLIKGRGLQFVFGDQKKLEVDFAAPELFQEEIASVLNSADIQKGYVFSLGTLVSFALEFKGSNEISAELAHLLQQMKSPNATERPDFKVVSELSQKWIKTHLPESSASDEIDKLMQPSLPYNLVDSEDSGSSVEAEPLAEEIAAAEQLTGSQKQFQDGSQSGGSSLSLESKGSQSCHASFDGLNRHASVHSADSMTEGREPVVHQVGLKRQPLASTSWSSYERLRHQFKDTDTQSAKVQPKIPHHCTPVRKRKRLLPEGTSNLPPRPPSSKKAKESIKPKDSPPPSPTEKMPTAPFPISTEMSTTLPPECFHKDWDDAPQTPPPPSSLPPSFDFTDNHESIHQEVISHQGDLVGMETSLFDEPKSSSEQGTPNATFEYSNLSEFTVMAQTKETSKDEFSFITTPPLPPSSPPSSVSSPTKLPPPSLSSSPVHHISGTQEEETKQAVQEAYIHLDREATLQEHGIVGRPTYESLTYEKDSSGDQSPQDSEPVVVEQVLRKKVDYWEGEEDLQELVHDENDYTIPKNVVQKLREQGKDPSKWNHPTQVKTPPSKETCAALVTVETNNREQQDKQSSEDDDISPYAKVKLQVHSPSISKGSAVEEIELADMAPPSLPLQAGDDQRYRASSMDDLKTPHVELSHPERSSMPVDPAYEMVDMSPQVAQPPEKATTTTFSKPKRSTSVTFAQDDEILSATKKPPVKLQRTEIEVAVQVPKGQRLVNVKTLHGPPIQLVVDRKILCNELLDKVVAHQDIKDKLTLGLAVVEDDELIFLEPTRKVWKYAPKGWLKTPVPDLSNFSSRHQPPLFVVQLRVMFFMSKVAQLNDPQTRNLHYTQLKQDIVTDQLYCSTEDALNLAALAFQAEHGNHTEVKEPDTYGQVQRYLSDRIRRELEGKNLRARLSELHSKHQGLSREQAELRFLQAAQQLDDYGKVYYQVSTAKQRRFPSDRLLAFSSNGISVYSFERELILECPWKTTDRIIFDNRKITLDVANHDLMFVYASSFRRAGYLVRLAKLYHHFSRKTRNFTPASSTSELMVGMPPMAEANNSATGVKIERELPQVEGYTGDILTVKILPDKMYGIGVTIRNHITPLHQKLVEIKDIKKDGPAAIDGKLKPGDFILRVNDNIINGQGHYHVGQLLKGSVYLVELTVFRQTPGTVTTAADVEGHGITDSADFRSDLAEVDPRLCEEPQHTRVKPRPISTTTLEKESTVLQEGGAAMLLSESESDRKTVILKKQNGTFGLAVMGSQGNPYRGVHISKITPGGPADKSGTLELGDQILAVNGKNVEGHGYDEVLQLISGAAETVELLVCKAIAQEDTISVVLNKEKGVLGIRLGTNSDGKVFVSKISKDSPADKSGQIRVRDILLEVNGQNLDGMPQRNVSELLLQLHSPLCLLLHRPPEQQNLPQKLEPVTEEVPKVDSSPPEDGNFYQFTVTLAKGSQTSFGFKIRRDPPERRVQKGLFVASVDKDPALLDGRLKHGDEILQINGQSLVGVLHRKGVQIIRSVANEGEFVVRREKLKFEHPLAGELETSDLPTRSGREEQEEEEKKKGSALRKLLDHTSQMEESTTLEEQSSKETEWELPPQQENGREEPDTFVPKDHGGEDGSFNELDNTIPPLPLSPPPRDSIIIEELDTSDDPTFLEES